MERKEKQSLYSVIYLILITLLFVSIPFGLFIESEIILFIINSIIRTLCIIYSLLYIKKEKLNKLKFNQITKKSLILLPLLILPFSNFFVVLFNNYHLTNEINYFRLTSDILLAILIATLEEITFRSQLLPEINKHKNDFIAIVLSSVIFGSVHLLNINSLGSIPYVLSQVVYTTLLGFVLGIIYLLSKNIILPIIFHALFNIINEVLIENLFNIKWNLSFFLINITIGILVLIYGLYCFNLNNRREKA